MARLNEPAPSVETLDILKRRFIRQNREIARVNSTQSLRIRTLESEISRLLSENIALRERVINLQYEVEKRPDPSVWDEVGVVKEKLDAKLAELGAWVQEVGNIQIAAKNRQLPRRKSMSRKSSQRSPDQKAWKNSLTLPRAEVTEGGDGRLPPIVEDKYFPRKTLDSDELLGILPDETSVTDSPDLGPPPVAHFEEGDPVKFDPTRGSASVNMEDVCPQSVLFANLETRKRRRESSSITHAKIHELTDAQPLQPGASRDEFISLVQPLKSGAKRKLNAREDESFNEPEKPLQDDGFIFNRKQVLADLNGSVSVKSDTLKAEGLVNQNVSLGPSKKSTQAEVKESTIGVENSRKALGPKSVNKDPTSPMKLGRSAAKEKVLESRDDITKNLPGRNRLKDRRPSKPVATRKELDTVGITGLDKKTAPEASAPPLNDLVPPALSDSSASRRESRDTPAPSDLDSEKSNPDAAGRGSRRSRGSVSYAEPNLRVKMRRPTKDLVDAVGTGERPQHLATVLVEESNMGVEFSSKKDVRTVFIKKEHNADTTDLWKSLPSTDNPHHHDGNRKEPTSPLRNKGCALPAELPTSVITDRRRRTLGLHRNDSEAAQPGSNHPGAGSAIAALAAGSQKARRREEESRVKERPAETQEIYDLAASSPTNELLDDNGKKVTESLAATARAARRHSSIPVDDGAPVTSDNQPGGPATGLAARRRERKRETLVGSSSGVVTTRGGGAGLELKSARSVAGLDQGGGGGGGGGGDQGVVSRAERAAGRRRSMML